MGGVSFNLRVHTRRLNGNGKKVAEILVTAFQATEPELLLCEQWLSKLVADSKCTEIEIKKVAELAHFDALKRIRPLTAHWMKILGLSIPGYTADQLKRDSNDARGNIFQPPRNSSGAIWVTR